MRLGARPFVSHFIYKYTLCCIGSHAASLHVLHMNSLSEYRFDEGEKIKNDTRAKEILVVC